MGKLFPLTIRNVFEIAHPINHAHQRETPRPPKNKGLQFKIRTQNENCKEKHESCMKQISPFKTIKAVLPTCRIPIGLPAAFNESHKVLQIRKNDSPRLAEDDDDARRMRLAGLTGGCPRKKEAKKKPIGSIVKVVHYVYGAAPQILKNGLGGIPDGA